MIQGLGERLQKLRKGRNLSQREVAAALGVSAAVISNYENSGRTPSVEQLLALARFYHCSTDYLLGFEQSAPASAIDTSNLSEKQRKLLQAFIQSL